MAIETFSAWFMDIIKEKKIWRSKDGSNKKHQNKISSDGKLIQGDIQHYII